MLTVFSRDEGVLGSLLRTVSIRAERPNSTLGEGMWVLARERISTVRRMGRGL